MGNTAWKQSLLVITWYGLAGYSAKRDLPAAARAATGPPGAVHLHICHCSAFVFLFRVDLARPERWRQFPGNTR